MKKYKFSIVMAAYNVAEYIEQAILSLVNQTIGFSNIQLIIINDGSVDDTDSICREYANKYKNIVYVNQKNQGVATARNEGLKRVTGTYVNFLDSDDYLSPGTLAEVYKFFTAHQTEIDIVGIPIYFFDGRKGDHLLNRKFDSNKVIDVMKTYDAPQLSSSSSFIKSSVAVKYKFQKGLKYGEDAKYLSDIMLNKMKYGIVKNAKYMYRKRSGENQSALQKTFTTKAWYIDTVDKFHFTIINECLKKFGTVPKYFQYLLMYDLQWRVNQKEISTEVLNKHEIMIYKNKIKEILKYIDDSIILYQKEINHRTKIHVIKTKYGTNKFTYKMTNKKTDVYINNSKLYSVASTGVTIDIIKIKNGILTLEGFYNIFHKDDLAKIKVQLFNEKNVYSAQTFYRKDKEIILLGEVINTPIGIKFEIPISEITSLGALIWINGYTSRVAITFGKFAPINSLISDKKNKYNLTYSKTNATISVEKMNFTSHVKYKKEFFKNLFKQKEYKVILFRLLAFLNYLFLFRKEIWLISDRFDVADDSGEHLFKYLRKNYKSKYNLIYVINKDSTDRKRLKKIGRVVDPNSFIYKILFLYATNVISSHAEDKIVNPFGRRKDKYIDLYRFKFTFLQHGIIKDDLSAWLNKYNKNFDMFLTSTYKEYDSILKGNYNYKSDVVKLTGLPRYDGLNNDIVLKQILLMPTWRANLASKVNKNGKRIYSETFKNSEFFQFYNNLINNEKLLNSLKENNSYILLAPHPNLRVQLSDFTSNEFVRIADNNLRYQEMFNKSALLITDYSSVAFDFAYLKKPVLYTQFDKASFFNCHSYDKGYFEYEIDGFGKVTNNIDETVNETIKFIQSNFKLEKKYNERIDKFFLYTDKHNCERVYNEILKLK